MSYQSYIAIPAVTVHPSCHSNDIDHTHVYTDSQGDTAIVQVDDAHAYAISLVATLSSLFLFLRLHLRTVGSAT